ncbi:MAG: hypothetical protein JKX76_00790 [Colwellia sp.]|nr:hypothetical protein [Colwellia sp.]
MNVTIDFVVGDNDTPTTIIQKIAYDNNTSPDFLYLPTKINIESLQRGQTIQIVVLDYLEMIKNFDKFKIFLNEVRKYKTVDKESDEMEVLVRVWIWKFRELIEVDLDTGANVITIQIKNFYSKDIDFEENVQTTNTIVQTYKDHYEKQQRLLDDLGIFQLDPKVIITNFDPLYYNYSFVIDTQVKSLESLFDSIVTNNTVPYVVHNNFYKIQDNFIPEINDSQSALISDKNSKLIRVWNDEYDVEMDFSSKKRVSSSKSFGIFMKMKLGLSGDEGGCEDESCQIITEGGYISVVFTKSKKGKLNVEIKVSSSHGTNNELINQNILGILPIQKTPKISKRTIQNVVSEFYLLDFPSNKFLLTDSFLNDPFFQKFVYIDEALRASRKSTILNCYFRDHSGLSKSYDQKSLKMSISSDLIKFKGVQFSSDYNIERSKRFTQVVIETKNLDELKYIHNIMVKLLTKYKHDEQSMLDFYRVIIPDFSYENVTTNVIQQDDEKIFSKLKYIEPRLFLANSYSRRCGDQCPTIVSEEKALEIAESHGIALNKDESLMKFPRENEYPIGPRFAGENPILPRWYYCENGFIGLIQNNNEDIEYRIPGKISIKERYPYLPKCFKRQQLKKTTKCSPKSTNDQSNYYNYLNGCPMKTSKQKLNTIINSDKILDSNIFGILPPGIFKIFQSLDYNSSYYRHGVVRSKSSFLNCLMSLYRENIVSIKGFNPDTFQQLINTNDVNNIKIYIDNFRKNLETHNIDFSICKQENWDTSVEEIKNAILNPDVYLSAEKYFRFFEELFNIEILIFTRDAKTITTNKVLRDNQEGSLVIPRNKYGHYKFKTDRDVVCIIEHFGSESDNLIYQQCEYVVFSKDKNVNMYKAQSSGSVQNVFDGSESVKLKNVFDSFNNFKTMSTSLKTTTVFRIDFQNQILTDIDSQVIDYYGKCRGYILHGNFVECEPMPPLNVRTIPHNPNGKIGSYQTAGTQLFRKYSHNKQISNVISQYFIRAYSLFVDTVISVEEAKGEDVPLEVTNSSMYDLHLKYQDMVGVDNMIHSDIKVDTSYTNDQYEIVSESFDENPSFFGMDGFSSKLIINSEELLRRLRFLLLRTLQQNRNYVMNLQHEDLIGNLYQTSRDFTVRSSENIFRGQETITKYINRKIPSFDLRTSPILPQLTDKQKKYKNQDIIDPKQSFYMIYRGLQDVTEQGQIVLAQTFSNLNSAISYGNGWVLSNSVAKIQRTVPTNYIYNDFPSDRRMVVKTRKSTERASSKFEILGYKVNGVNQFTVVFLD